MESGVAEKPATAMIADWVCQEQAKGLLGLQFYFPPASDDASVDELAQAILELLTAKDLEKLGLADFLCEDGIASQR